MIVLARAWKRLTRLRRRPPAAGTRTTFHRATAWPTEPTPEPAVLPETPDELTVRAQLLGLGVHPGGHR